MDYTQLKQPNLSIVGQDGYCLAYVTEVFGVANAYPSATVAWANTQFKHTDEPPANIAVPIWFTYNGPDGHVAVSTPSGIYSTSAQGDKVFGSIADLVAWMGEGMTYLGWSEDINNVQVVEGDDMTEAETEALIDSIVTVRDARMDQIQASLSSLYTIVDNVNKTLSKIANAGGIDDQAFAAIDADNKRIDSLIKDNNLKP